MFNKQIAGHNDIRIEKLARYAETRGLTRHIKSKQALFAKFSEFKLLVKRGEFTIDELEEDIYNIYGIVDKELDSGRISDNIEKYMIKKADKDLVDRDLAEHEKKQRNRPMESSS